MLTHFQPDLSICSYNGTLGARSMSFQVLGNPLPQLRMKFGLGRYHDPSGRLKTNFSTCTSDVLTYMGVLFRPFFPLNIQVGIKIVYVIERPKYHFTSNDRNNGVVREEYRSRNIGPFNRQGDVDNYVKFTLDAISRRVVLTNDKQVVHVEATKMFESSNEGGFTYVEVYQWHEENTMSYAPTHRFDED